MNIEKEESHKYHPTEEYKYFVHDPLGDTIYFRTEQERDIFAQGMIQAYLDDGWDEEVENIFAGIATHHTIMFNVKKRPEAKDFDNDDALAEAEEEYGCMDCPYSCDYRLAPLLEQGEKLTYREIIGEE